MRSRFIIIGLMMLSMTLGAKVSNPMAEVVDDNTEGFNDVVINDNAPKGLVISGNNNPELDELTITANIMADFKPNYKTTLSLKSYIKKALKEVSSRKAPIAPKTITRLGEAELPYKQIHNYKIETYFQIYTVITSYLACLAFKFGKSKKEIEIANRPVVQWMTDVIQKTTNEQTNMLITAYSTLNPSDIKYLEKAATVYNYLSLQQAEVRAQYLPWEPMADMLAEKIITIKKEVEELFMKTKKFDICALIMVKANREMETLASLKVNDGYIEKMAVKCKNKIEKLEHKVQLKFADDKAADDINKQLFEEPDAEDPEAYFIFWAEQLIHIRYNLAYDRLINNGHQAEMIEEEKVIENNLFNVGMKKKIAS